MMKRQSIRELHNCDCMDYMATCEDGKFDLAICDPPYGINCGDQRRQKSRTKLAKTTNFHYSGWDKKIPSEKIFNEIFRISKDQIIWGGNYFIEHLYNTSSMVRSEEHTSELQSHSELVCRLLLEKKKN